jgi:hypothetical protein
VRENIQGDLANGSWHFWPLFIALCDAEVKKIIKLLPVRQIQAQGLSQC